MFFFDDDALKKEKYRDYIKYFFQQIIIFKEMGGGPIQREREGERESAKDFKRDREILHDRHRDSSTYYFSLSLSFSLAREIFQERG